MHNTQNPDFSQAHLIADIGGTNARFAITVNGTIFETQILSTHLYLNFDQALKAYLTSLQKLNLKIQSAIFAIAAPITNTCIRFTNSPWTINIEHIKHMLKCPIEIINDFVAQAMSLNIAELQLMPIHTPTKAHVHTDQGTKLILGPGTGLGVAYITNGKINTTEAGHITLHSRTPLEFEIFQYISKQYGHVSAERVCCGAGLETLYTFFSGQKKPAIDIYNIGRIEKTSDEAKAIQQFLSYFGSIVSQLAISVNASAGIYLSGGIALKFADLFSESAFLDSYLEKGRFTSYMSRMPIWLICDPQPALAGLAYATTQHA